MKTVVFWDSFTRRRPAFARNWTKAERLRSRIMNMEEKAPEPEFKYFRTGIVTLDAILKEGIRCLPGKGMLGLIVGPAGAGKSILALQMCCSFLLERGMPAPAQGDEPSKTPAPHSPPRIVRPYGAVYITHEESDLVEAKVDDFNCFQKKRPVGEKGKGQNSSQKKKPFGVQQDSLDSLLTDPTYPCTLHICRVGLDEENQSRVLQNIFDTIAQRIKWLKGRDEQENERREEQKQEPLNENECQADPLGSVLVCVDNLRTIHKEALQTAMGGLANHTTKDRQEDSQDVNFYKRLHRDCVNGHVHTFLIMEEDIPEEPHSERYNIAHRSEVFAADLVIRLGIRTYSTEYRNASSRLSRPSTSFTIAASTTSPSSARTAAAENRNRKWSEGS